MMIPRLEQQNAATAVVAILAAFLLVHPRTAKSMNVFGESSELLEAFQQPAMKNDLNKAKNLTRRTIDGTGNNEANPMWGSAGQPVLKLCSAVPPSEDLLPNVRTISGEVADDASASTDATGRSIGGESNSFGASDLFWQWGQFIDHDFVLIEHSDPTRRMDIDIPTGDPVFDAAGIGGQTMPLTRSDTDANGVPVNSITAYLDASNVYGSDDVRADRVRTKVDGLLKTSGDGKFLPLNDESPPLPNAPHDNLANFFVAGDVRANEQLGLLAMHTLWVREHNGIAKALKEVNPTWTDEDLYQVARKIVGAEIQVITYHEFLPLLLGPYMPPRYKKYDEECDAGMADEFATAAFRLGHTLVSPELMTLRADMSVSDRISMVEAFFTPDKLQETATTMDEIIRGQSAQVCQALDHKVADELRNMLFEGSPAAHSGGIGFDLAALNMQRGRDHGLCNLNAVRDAYRQYEPELQPHAGIGDINSSNDGLTAALISAYGHVDDVEAWIGMISEEHMPYAMVGETLAAVLSEQFDRTRRCDRFWYEKDLPRLLHMFVEGQTLAKVIRRNTDIGFEMSSNCMEEAQFFNGEMIDPTSVQ